MNHWTQLTLTRRGVALNSLTSGARRDKFFGSPWHKNVPARIEVLVVQKGSS
jgi:hypothetical protein